MTQDKAVRMAEALFEAENKMLEEVRGQRDPYMLGVTRRQVLRAAVGIGGGAALVGAARSAVAESEGPPAAATWEVAKDPTRVQGRPIGAEGGYGMRSMFEREVRKPWPSTAPHSPASLTPLAHGHGIVTPSGLHFERHHAGTPFIDSDQFELVVHGMVERPMKYFLEDLEHFPSVSRFHFIECSGNTGTEWKKPTFKTVQGTHGLTSTSEWTGVPLSTVMAEVGVKPGASWMLAEGFDAAVMTRSIPIEKCWDDALLAYGQNGEATRPEQGYPLRLLLPGWEGNMQIKWLRRLEFSDAPFMTREETSKYTDLLDGGVARQFTFVMEAKSVITFPSGEMRLPQPGDYEITGLAWSGRGRVARVEVSTDGGRSWRIAALQSPVLPKCHTRFALPWHWDGTPAVLQSRCVDETGYTQPTLKQLVSERGVSGGKFGSFYHNNGIQSWAIDSDGGVTNVHHHTA